MSHRPDPHPDVPAPTRPADAPVAARDAQYTAHAREMPCPVCGTPMPDLKGGKASICPVCGFKDSCCF